MLRYEPVSMNIDTFTMNPTTGRTRAHVRPRTGESRFPRQHMRSFRMRT